MDFQLPKEHTHMTYSMGSIHRNDAPLQVYMVLVRIDTGPGGEINYLEATASLLLHHHPVDNKS